MARVHNPTLFSTYFKVQSQALAAAGLIDPFVDVDVPLFIDPVLLAKSGNQIIATAAAERFRKHFEILVRMLAISNGEGDAAWKGARRQLDLSEPPENGLGYGGTGRSGNSRPELIRETILRTSKEVITLGASDPEMISLMGFFEEDVGPDTIGDMTTTVIMDDLAQITEAFCQAHGVPVFSFDVCPTHKLPKYVNARGKQVPIVLVPTDIVRDLPIANDWSDIERAAMENARIRERVNRLLGGIAEPTVAERKAALRTAALGSASDFDFFLAAVKGNVSNYDPNLDALGYYRLKEILTNGLPDLKQAAAYNLKLGAHEIFRVVIDTIELFRRHVEAGNLWEELWVNGKPKKERASQLIYYAIADCFCKANDVDISPEANMGGGPIDFKFSSGYQARVLVEMKRSGGTVVHGYEKQLEFYKTASQTDFAVFVIIDYGDGGNKFNEIRKVREGRLARGERASEIVVIDAIPKLSASKRK
ncbi:chromosomal replication initiator DnaA [Bradyrhizobium sp. RT7b]|uniref:chromosomal replication initiator DnaA n=1 Tax=unclassified Bradyrhizobium TaxID=2631580 RepID=UPI003393B6D5